MTRRACRRSFTHHNTHTCIHTYTYTYAYTYAYAYTCICVQAVFTHDTVYFFMDFSLVWMPAVVFALTSVVLAVHAVACTLSVCKRRLLMDAQRARELLEEGPSAPSSSAPSSSAPSAPSPQSAAAHTPLGRMVACASKYRAAACASGAEREDDAQQYLLWRDKPGSAAATRGDGGSTIPQLE